MKTRLLLGLAAIIAAAAVWAFYSSRAGGTVGLEVGDHPPPFQLTDAWDRPIDLPTLTDGKPGLIFFTATWCTPCVQGLRELQRFEADAGPRFNVLVVFVDPNETEDDVRAYRDRYGFPSRWYFAKDPGQMTLDYRVQALDTKYLIDASGVIRYKSLSPADYRTWVRVFAQVGVGP